MTLNPERALFYDDTDRRPRWRRVVDRLLRREFRGRLLEVVEIDPDGPFTITWNAAGIFATDGPVMLREVSEDEVSG